MSFLFICFLLARIFDISKNANFAIPILVFCLCCSYHQLWLCFPSIWILFFILFFLLINILELDSSLCSVIYYYFWQVPYWNIAISTASHQFALSYARLEAAESLKIWITPKRNYRLENSLMTVPQQAMSLWYEWMELPGRYPFYGVGWPAQRPTCGSPQKYSGVVGCGWLLISAGGGQRRIQNKMEELLSLRLATMSAVNTCSASSLYATR